MSQRKNEAVWVEKEQRWRIRETINGKRMPFYSSTKGRKGKIEAERKADEAYANTASDDPRFESLWNDFIKDAERTTGKGNARNLESIGRNHLLPKLKLCRVLSITEQDWQDRLTEAFEKGRAKHTIMNIRDAITAFITYARKRKIKMDRPEDLSVNRKAPQGKRIILTPSKIKTLFEVDWITRRGQHVTCWYINAWRLKVLSGMRSGEVAGMQWQDIEEGTVLHIQRGISDKGEVTNCKNDNAIRSYVLSEMMKEVLEAQRAMLKTHGIISPWVFCDEYGHPVTPKTVYRRWSHYRKQHDMQCSINELRHTMISYMRPHVHDVDLKIMVGHSRKGKDITDNYTHAVEGRSKQLAITIDKVFCKIIGRKAPARSRKKA